MANPEEENLSKPGFEKRFRELAEKLESGEVKRRRFLKLSALAFGGLTVSAYGLDYLKGFDAAGITGMSSHGGGGDWNSIVLRSSGSDVRYLFICSGEVEAVSTDIDDDVFGNKATGVLGGEDSFRFKGKITDFYSDGPVEVDINGETFGRQDLKQSVQNCQIGGKTGTNGRNTNPDSGSSQLLHGAYLTSYSNLQSFEQWLGTSIDIVSTTYSQVRTSQWHDPLQWATFDRPKKFIDEGGEMILSTSFVPKDGRFKNEGYRGAANGKYDSDWRKMAKAFADAGVTDSIILRPSAEYNFSWSSDSWVGTAAPSPEKGAEWFKQAFKRQVEIFEEEGAGNVRFVLNPSAGNGEGDIPFEKTFPGSQYVWGAGPDFYDGYGPYTDGVTTQERKNSFDDRINSEEGLKFYADFCEKNDLELIFPEWGLWKRSYRDAGGGDNPYFIREFIEWAEKQGAYAQCYWLEQDDHSFWPVDENPLPDAASAWKNKVTN